MHPVNLGTNIGTQRYPGGIGGRNQVPSSVTPLLTPPLTTSVKSPVTPMDRIEVKRSGTLLGCFITLLAAVGVCIITTLAALVCCGSLIKCFEKLDQWIQKRNQTKLEKKSKNKFDELVKSNAPINNLSLSDLNELRQHSGAIRTLAFKVGDALACTNPQQKQKQLAAAQAYKKDHVDQIVPKLKEHLRTTALMLQNELDDKDKKLKLSKSEKDALIDIQNSEERLLHTTLFRLVMSLRFYEFAREFPEKYDLFKKKIEAEEKRQAAQSTPATIDSAHTDIAHAENCIGTEKYNRQIYQAIGYNRFISQGIPVRDYSFFLVSDNLVAEGRAYVGQLIANKKYDVLEAESHRAVELALQKVGVEGITKGMFEKKT